MLLLFLRCHPSTTLLLLLLRPAALLTDGGQLLRKRWRHLLVVYLTVRWKLKFLWIVKHWDVCVNYLVDVRRCLIWSPVTVLILYFLALLSCSPLTCIRMMLIAITVLNRWPYIYVVINKFLDLLRWDLELRSRGLCEEGLFPCFIARGEVTISRGGGGSGWV